MNTEAERRALQLKAFELKRSGKEYREIAEQLGISLGSAYNYVRRYFDELDAVAKESADDLRRLEAARLDIWLDRLNQQIARADEVRIDPDDASEAVFLVDLPKLITTGVKLMERRAKLLGLDAPTKVDVANVSDARKKLAAMTPEERLALHEKAAAEERAKLAERTQH